MSCSKNNSVPLCRMIDHHYAIYHQMSFNQLTIIHCVLSGLYIENNVPNVQFEVDFDSAALSSECIMFDYVLVNSTHKYAFRNAHKSQITHLKAATYQTSDLRNDSKCAFYIQT